MVQNSHICFREDWELYPELKKIDAQYLSLVQFKTKKKKKLIKLPVSAMALELRILEIKQRTRKQEETLQCQIINPMTQHNLGVIMSCSAITKGMKGEGN